MEDIKRRPAPNVLKDTEPRVATVNVTGIVKLQHAH